MLLITHPRPMHGSKRGFTLTELAIVIGVIGIMMGGVWNYSSSARQTQRLASTAQDIVLEVDAVRTNTSGSPSVTGGISGMVSNLVGMNAMPPELQRKTATICGTITSTYADNLWSGGTLADACGTFRVCSWHFTPGAPGTDDHLCNAASTNIEQSFAIELTGLDYGTCMQVAQVVSPNQPPGLEDIDINTKSAVASGGGIPLSPTNASNWCKSTAPNTVDFVYSLRPPQS